MEKHLWGTAASAPSPVKGRNICCTISMLSMKFIICKNTFSSFHLPSSYN